MNPAPANRIFEGYASAYDLLYQQKDYAAEVAWVLGIIQNYCNISGPILELGCGTGGHASHLSARGIEVTGIDQSAQMLEQARSKSIKGFTPILADMRALDLNKRFPLAISLFHCIGYLTENEDLKQCFHSVARQLEPGGLFAFDGWSALAVLNQPMESRTRIGVHAERTVQRHSQTEVDRERRIATVSFDVLEQNGAEQKVSREIHRMRFFDRDEIECLAHETGFSMVHFGPFMRTDALTAAEFDFFTILRLKP